MAAHEAGSIGLWLWSKWIAEPGAVVDLRGTTGALGRRRARRPRGRGGVCCGAATAITRPANWPAKSDSLRGDIAFQHDAAGAGQLLRQSRAAEDREECFAWDAARNLLDDIGRESCGQVEGAATGRGA